MKLIQRKTWKFLDMPVQRDTVLLDGLIHIGRHYPKCESIAVEIGTKAFHAGLAWPISQSYFMASSAIDGKTYRRRDWVTPTFFGLRLGRPLISLYLSRRGRERALNALEFYAV